MIENLIEKLLDISYIKLNRITKLIRKMENGVYQITILHKIGFIIMILYLNMSLSFITL